MTDEDVKQLFEVLILSYFSRLAAEPKQTLVSALEHTGYRQDYFEGRNAEIILAIADSICGAAKKHFPSFGTGYLPDYYKGADIAEKLEITDAFMLGCDSVVIVLPQRVYQHLTHEHASRHPANRP